MSHSSRRSFRFQAGYTLLEMLCAVIVVAAGITYIFPTFFKSVDALSLLPGRMRAGILMESIAAEAQFHLKKEGDLEEFTLKGKKGFDDPQLAYRYETKAADPFMSSYELTVVVEWQDRRKNRFERSFFISRNV